MAFLKRARFRWAHPPKIYFPSRAGLALGDKVVLNGNFLIDSQAHLSSGMSGLYGGSKEFASRCASRNWRRNRAW